MASATRFVPLSLALVSLLACSRATSGRESEPLGYGPARGDLANGYVEKGSPFERPTPPAWPVAQQPARTFVAAPPPTLPPVSPPPSADVQRLCVHVTNFLMAEATKTGDVMDPSVLADFCHIQARTEKLARTSEQWQAFLSCMLASDADPEFEACEREHPTALFEKTEHEREFEACQHLAMTTLYEELGSDTNLEASELEPFRPVIRECITELTTEEKPKHSPEHYEAVLDCVLEQSTSAGMEACE